MISTSGNAAASAMPPPGAALTGQLLLSLFVGIGFFSHRGFGLPVNGLLVSAGTIRRVWHSGKDTFDRYTRLYTSAESVLELFN